MWRKACGSPTQCLESDSSSISSSPDRERSSDSGYFVSDRTVAELNYFRGVAVYLCSRTLTNKILILQAEDRS